MKRESEKLQILEKVKQIRALIRKHEVVAAQEAITWENDISIIEYEARLVAYQNDLHMITNSKSWRFTKPFRIALAGIKNLSPLWTHGNVSTIPREKNQRTCRNKQKRKILCIMTLLMVGGVPKILFELARILSDEFEFFFITTIEGCEEWKDKFQNIATVASLRLIPPAQRKAWILDFVKKQSIDHVFVFDSPLGYEMMPAIKNEMPFVVTSCHFNCESVDMAVADAVKKYGKYSDYCIIGNSKLRILAQSLSISKEKIFVIRNGTDIVNTFSPQTQSAYHCSTNSLAPIKTILWIGRFQKEKAPLDFVKIAACFRKRDDLFFAMFGDGPLKETALTQGLFLANWNAFNSIHDVARLLYHAHALVLTSLHETTPLVVVEALAMNVPVIATRVGEVGHLIVNGKNGYIVESGDIEGIVQRIEDLSSVNRKAIRASSNLVPFSLPTMAEAYRKVFQLRAPPSFSYNPMISRVDP